MSEGETDQLLQFIRNEVVPILLERGVDGGMTVMVQRLKLEYPDLDLFSRS